MRIIYDFHSLESADQGASVAIGNFDGIHKGHQSVIDVAKHQAVERNIPAGVVTFEPHPRQFFRPKDLDFRLMNHHSKVNRLQQLGVDILYELTFDSNLAMMSSMQFVSKVLHQGLGIKVAVVGNDFQYGKNRTGTVTELTTIGKSLGIDVIVAPMLESFDLNYSSTSVRQAISAGKPEEAFKLLGYWPRLEGKVIHGEKRGRKLGYPTANIDLAGLLPPRQGIYSVLIDILSGPYTGQTKGVASIGVRPTFGEKPLNLEVFIFDFDGDIYDEYISVALIAFQRPEICFADTDKLVAQMKFDADVAAKNLATIILT